MEQKVKQLNEKGKQASEKRKESIKRMREEMRKKTEGGNLSATRLGFVRTLMENRQITVKEMSERIGITPQMMSYIFNVNDDCTLDVLYRMMNEMNIDCSVSYELPAPKKQKNAANYEFGGDVIVGKRNILPDYVQNVPADARLRFLADTMKETELNLVEFSDKVGIFRQAFRRFFKKDDIKISQICDIANALGAKIHWQLNEIK